MPHLRKRSVEGVVRKSLSFWPATSLLGPRQCGKSTFLRELLTLEPPADWVSLDRKADRKLANENPELFLSRFAARPLIIDEAHKAPDLFDELKAEIDEHRKPGRFILSGSVFFSKKVGIQEALTGRTSIIRMDTMTLPETLAGKNFGLKELHQYLLKGGMPGACFVRSTEESSMYWEQWIETTCHRDLKIFSKGRLSGDLAEEILEATCRLEQPTLAAISKATGNDARRIRTHVEGLEDLFVLRRVQPSTAGIGKDLYLPFDCGMAHYLGAEQRRLWQVGFLVHTLNQAVFSGRKLKSVRYYLTSRHSFIDFELEGRELHLYCDKPNPGRPEQMTARAAKKVQADRQVFIHCATDAFDRVENLKEATWLGWAYGWKQAGRSRKETSPD
jgi:predicted AAA+ superfamily ATPase